MEVRRGYLFWREWKRALDKNGVVGRVLSYLMEREL